MAVKILIENRETKVCLDGFLWTPHPPTAFRPARGPGRGAENQTGGKQKASPHLAAPPLWDAA